VTSSQSAWLLLLLPPLCRRFVLGGTVTAASSGNELLPSPLPSLEPYSQLYFSNIGRGAETHRSLPLLFFFFPLPRRETAPFAAPTQSLARLSLPLLLSPLPPFMKKWRSRVARKTAFLPPLWFDHADLITAGPAFPLLLSSPPPEPRKFPKGQNMRICRSSSPFFSPPLFGSTSKKNLAVLNDARDGRGRPILLFYSFFPSPSF